MSRPAVITPIAETAIYQTTAQLADKYKAQRDDLLTILRHVINAPPTAMNLGILQSLAKQTIADMEQSL